MKAIVTMFLVLTMCIMLGMTVFCIVEWATVVNSLELPHWLPWPVPPVGTFVCAFLLIACGITLMNIWD